MKEVARPTGVFRGVNFMTPNVIRYLSGRHQGMTAWIEISEGTGFDHEPIYGVTVAKSNGGRFDPDPSRCCFSMEEVNAFIKVLFSS